MVYSEAAEEVLRFFREISTVPRGSGYTDKIASFLVGFAEKRSLACERDAYNNVIIKKPATEGYEDKPTIIIEGHTDMVCAKKTDSDHDFEKEGIELVEKEDSISANGTTLGADDGIGVSIALAILDSSTLKHPAIEAVFTVDEEIGMLGASAIDVSELNGKYLLNIDHDDDTCFLAGCAGGATAISYIPVKMTKIAKGKIFNISITGYRGGHSGGLVLEGHANAIKAITDIARFIVSGSPSHVITIEGGDKDNAIPANAYLTMVTEDEEKFRSAFEQITDNLKKENCNEKDAEYEISTSSDPASEMMTKESESAVLDFIYGAPTGLISMDKKLPNMAETSLNLGILRQSENEIRASFCVRSSINNERSNLCQKLKELTLAYGGSFDTSGIYDAWEYKTDSKLRDEVSRIYKEINGVDPQYAVIHAGVECGIFTSKIPGLDSVSFGPDLYDIHTFNESMDIKSLEKTWNFTKRFLEECDL